MSFKMNVKKRGVLGELINLKKFDKFKAKN